MDMYQGYEKPPSRRRIVRRVLLGAAVALGIYVFSFAAFVVRGHRDAGLAGWEFNYLGRGAWASPKKEDFLSKAYRPLYSLSRALGVPIVYLGRTL